METSDYPGEAESISPAAEQEDYINLAQFERRFSMIGGGLLALYGLSRGSLKGLALAAAGGLIAKRGLTGHCPAYAALGVNSVHPEEVRILETITIDRPANEIYAFWRDLENLPTFMRHLDAVRALEGGRSQWSARLPKGIGALNWEAQVTEDVPGERLAWRSLPGAAIENAGAVEFREAPGGRGTEMRVEIEYRPPAGGVGAAAARMFNPALSQMIREDVRRFRSLMEAGEIPTVDGQPVGMLH